MYDFYVRFLCMVFMHDIMYGFVYGFMYGFMYGFIFDLMYNFIFDLFSGQNVFDHSYVLFITYPLISSDILESIPSTRH